MKIFRLQDVHSARCQQCHRGEGDGSLHHHRDLGPARKYWRIGWRKSGAGVEREEEVVHETRRPILVHRLLGLRSHGHLGKKKVSFGVVAANMPCVTTTPKETFF